MADLECYCSSLRHQVSQHPVPDCIVKGCCVPFDAQQEAERIYDRVGEIVVEKNANYKIVQTTEEMKQIWLNVITDALRATKRRVWGKAATRVQEVHGKTCATRPNSLDCQIHQLDIEFRRRAQAVGRAPRRVHE